MVYEMKDAVKKVLKSQLEPTILKILTKNPSHGYEIIKILRKFGCYFGPSTVYPLLNSMEEKGLIRSEWRFEKGRPRKNYSITLKGIEYLRTYLKAEEIVRSELNNILAGQFHVLLPEEVEIKTSKYER